jgi:hypothetical protein
MDKDKTVIHSKCYKTYFGKCFLENFTTTTNTSEFIENIRSQAAAKDPKYHHCTFNISSSDGTKGTRFLYINSNGKCSETKLNHHGDAI